MAGKRRIAAILILVTALIAGMFVADARAEIRLGILPRLNPVEMYTMFKPLADYWSREIGEKTTLVIPMDFESFKTQFKSGKLDIGFANSVVLGSAKLAGFAPVSDREYDRLR
ncbi:MAG TPA: PhnD/SsuA/transferrin family substrate-binding protein, partial [Nitrospirota bacterium]